MEYTIASANNYIAAQKDVNVGYENVNNLTQYYDDIGESEPIETILTNIKEPYKSEVVIYEGEMYYIYNPDINNEEEVKWCFEIGTKIWGNYTSWQDFSDNKPEPRYVHNGRYENINGVYMCIPDLTSFDILHTRYVMWDNNGIEEVGTWVIKDPPTDSNDNITWYDYKNKKWANVLCENDGKQLYFTWIPRYMYKMSTMGNGLDLDGNVIPAQTTNVIFVDSSNNYINAETEETKTEQELLEAGYLLPESFTFGDDNTGVKELAGYWASKYELSDVSVLTMQAKITAKEKSIVVSDIVFPQSGILQQSQVKTYKYYINAKEKETRDVSGTNGVVDAVELTGLNSGGRYAVNVTALDEHGQALASYTITVKTTKPSAPALTGFNPSTTFYVTWDELGNEYNEIPINMPPPENWYIYSDKKWANIVTRNDGKELYFTWIPRYQYRVLNTDRPVAERSSLVEFIDESKTEPDAGYVIPESFQFGDSETDGAKQLAGYWASKYELSAASAPVIDTDIGMKNDSIKISNMRGTRKSEITQYAFYLDGILKDTNDTGNYIYEELIEGSEHTINIICRGANNVYIGAITKEVVVQGPNAPDLSGFNPNCTYFVMFDNSGNEIDPSKTDPNSKIQLNASGQVTNAPIGWFDYADKKWANVVTVNNGKKLYWTWIPRYAYKVLYGDVGATVAYSDIVWINGTTTNVPNGGYVIPESFQFGDVATGGEKELTGYWSSKYELSQ